MCRLYASGFRRFLESYGFVVFISFPAENFRRSECRENANAIGDFLELVPIGAVLLSQRKFAL